MRKLTGLKPSLAPPIVVVPLTKDGCIDTEVNIEQAMGKLSLGCVSPDAGLS